MTRVGSQDSRTLRALLWVTRHWAPILAIPFYAGFFGLLWLLAVTPPTAGMFERIKIMEAAFFSMGLAVGIEAVGMWTAASTERYRLRAAAHVIYAVSLMTLGSAVRAYVIDLAAGSRSIPYGLVLTVFLWVWALRLAAASRRQP